MIDLIEKLVPVKIVCGENSIIRGAELLKPLGKKALIVTGKSSYKNDALNDVAAALKKNNQSFAVFDAVTPNPTIFCVRSAIDVLKRENADFIIAIGGGSPMDAAKAIATLAVQDRSDEDIFKGGYKDEALPMAHVPTTAGTGSEVTPYSILTNDFDKTKTSISSKAMFPKIAFLDARYTYSLGKNVTVNTAIDALSHAVEGMFTLKATPETDSAALNAISVIYPRLKEIAAKKEISEEMRKDLLSASCLAGAVIAHTGTTVVHSMGYSLTYYHGIPHGRANGILLGSMLSLCAERQKEKTDKIFSACGIDSADEFSSLMYSLLAPIENINDTELFSYALEASKSKKLPNITYAPTYNDILHMYLTSFSKRRKIKKR